MTLFDLALAAILVAALGAAGYLWQDARLRRRSLLLVDARAARAAGQPAEEMHVRTFPPRYRFAGPLAGVVALALFSWIFQLPAPFAFASALMIGVITYLIEDLIAERRMTLIETQLADSIDLMVGSLRAGAAWLAALEAALRESREPLRSQLRQVVGRIRLGDDPVTAMQDVAVRVPLETFRFFSLSLAVHWETGGSMASTLSTIGRTIRDRIEMARRIQAQSVEAQVSVAAVLGISYAIAFLMWRANPQSLEEFLTNPLGSYLAAGAMCLQAVGVFWVWRMGRASF